ncbi:MAG: gliding motility-associated C-terminal domain-containing protein, partial [Bacteroidota bacterium]
MKILAPLLPLLLLLLACNPNAPSTNLINQQACTVGLIKAPVGGSDTLYVPNIFTPDGDGFNDAFYILFNETVPSLSSYQLTIEDPGGNQVFFSNDISERWNALDSDNEPLQSTLYDWRGSLSLS